MSKLSTPNFLILFLSESKGLLGKVDDSRFEPEIYTMSLEHLICQ